VVNARTITWVGDAYRVQRLHVRRAFGEDQADLALIEIEMQQVER
jgi:hypothetical protein